MFKWMAAKGMTDCRGLTLETVRKYYLKRAGELHRSSVFTIRYALKHITEFLRARGDISFDCEALFGLKVSGYRTLIAAMPDAEIGRVLESVDRTSPRGKRNFAMYSIAAATGLRSCDITAMKLRDIDWRAGEIRVVQRKTGRPITLPLTETVGEAIKDYILNARPDVESDHLFLLLDAPHRRMHRNSPNKDFKSYFPAAGVEKRPYDGKSFYSLRRAVGRRYVERGLKVTEIAQLLGHSTLAAVDRYITLSPDALRGCALGFGGIEPIAEGGVR